MAQNGCGSGSEGGGFVIPIPNPKFVDLKPNRLLLDPKFDGYKLSLDPLPTYVSPISTGVDKVGPAEDQYSVQHAKLFGLHNFLHKDHFHPYVTYVVDKNWIVHWISFDNVKGQFLPTHEVWAIPSRGMQMQTKGRYNVTLTFVSENLVVVGDGCNAFFMLETGDRRVPGSWNIVHEQNEVQEINTSQLGRFTVLDAKTYDKDNGQMLMDILILRLVERIDPSISKFLDDFEDYFLGMSPNHPFVSKLNWVTLRKEGERWAHDVTTTLIGPSAVDYASLETKGTGILLSSENHFSFYNISNEQPLKRGISKKHRNDNQQGNKADYVWYQNEKEVVLLFKVPLSHEKSSLSVTAHSNNISVAYNGVGMLEGELTNPIKSDAVEWSMNAVCVTDVESQQDGDVMSSSEDGNAQNLTEYHSLEISLQKAEPINWEGDSVVKDDKATAKGMQVLDPEDVANIQEQLAHLCSDKWNDDPMRAKVCDPDQEECDGLPSDTSALMRIDRLGRTTSHCASLGGHQWLFSARINESSIPSLCIRHDVDGLLWQPVEFVSLETWKLDHIGTFSALGYVQASKIQRKFTVCSPDLSYVAICDAVKHVYVYRQPQQIGSDLRNRKTGEIISHIAKQHVVALDPPLEILGVSATNDFLVVLTPQNIHAIRVKESMEEV